MEGSKMKYLLVVLSIIVCNFIQKSDNQGNTPAILFMPPSNAPQQGNPNSGSSVNVPQNNLLTPGRGGDTVSFNPPTSPQVAIAGFNIPGGSQAANTGGFNPSTSSQFASTAGINPPLQQSGSSVAANPSTLTPQQSAISLVPPTPSQGTSMVGRNPPTSPQVAIAGFNIPGGSQAANTGGFNPSTSSQFANTAGINSPSQQSGSALAVNPSTLTSQQFAINLAPPTQGTSMAGFNLPPPPPPPPPPSTQSPSPPPPPPGSDPCSPAIDQIITTCLGISIYTLYAGSGFRSNIIAYSGFGVFLDQNSRQMFECPRTLIELLSRRGKTPSPIKCPDSPTISSSISSTLRTTQMMYDQLNAQLENLVTLFMTTCKDSGAAYTIKYKLLARIRYSRDELTRLLADVIRIENDPGALYAKNKELIQLFTCSSSGCPPSDSQVTLEQDVRDIRQIVVDNNNLGYAGCSGYPGSSGSRGSCGYGCGFGPR
ncbi:uncharacterized protein LOC141850575 [Brevipalpus obovatus]|uniref:uncharacterized protein LOC141850575 n=1 Tax=Brevipalpus obovatus TaxID=246614 RepID=UPI003D9E9FFA